MTKILKYVLLGFLGGVIVGFFMAQQQQEREKQAASDAYNNDPEVVALRKERALDRQVRSIFDAMEDDDV